MLVNFCAKVSVRYLVNLDPSCYLIWILGQIQIPDVTHPSVQGFFSFCKSVSDNSNYMYLLNQVTHYAHAVVNFRVSLRHNNCMLGYSAQYKLMDLFHGHHIPAN